MSQASYTALVARAVPGLYSAELIEWQLPLARGHALIHAGRLLDGEILIWPDPMLSRRGRWWRQVKHWFRRRRERVTADPLRPQSQTPQRGA